MSKRESIARLILIIGKLRKRPADFEEISNYLDSASYYQEYDFRISKRTFQRDIADILSLFHIDIKYNYSNKSYFIGSDWVPNVNERILEAFDVFYALNLTDRLSEHIHFEKRRSQGTENLYDFLRAIKNKLQVRFEYRKFWEEEVSQRRAEPYALKEFKKPLVHNSKGR